MARPTFRANIKAPKSSYAVPASFPVDVVSPSTPSPIGRVPSAIFRLQPVARREKKAMYSAIRRRYPGLTARSSVIPTYGGSGTSLCTSSLLFDLVLDVQVSGVDARVVFAAQLHD